MSELPLLCFQGHGVRFYISFRNESFTNNNKKYCFRPNPLLDLIQIRMQIFGALYRYWYPVYPVDPVYGGNV